MRVIGRMGRASIWCSQSLYTFPIDGAWYVIHEAGAYGSAECLRCMWIVSFPGRGETCLRTCADGTDVTLHDLAVLTDAFYIGGTKVGALFGECVVINHPAMKEDFRYLMKQKGGMLAKGRLLGLQFQAMFENDLYMEMGRHADRLAMKLKKGLLEKGYHFYIDSITNQQFVIVEDQKLQELEQQFCSTMRCVTTKTIW